MCVLWIELEIGGTGESEEAGLAFDAQGMRATELECCLIVFKLVVVAHHEGITVPDFFLQPNGPIHRLGFGVVGGLGLADI